MMQTAENILLGQVQRAGAAAIMQSAAARNERAGVVGHSTMNEVAVGGGHCDRGGIPQASRDNRVRGRAGL